MQSRLAGLVVLMLASFAVRAESPLADAAEQQNWTAVASLLKPGADTNATQADGSTALLWAAHYDNLATVSALLDKGANANAKNRYGITPLAEAAQNGNAAIVERLLAAGADVNAALPEGDTPLMIASRTGSVPVVKMLLSKGAAVDARDAWHGETALMWAAGENHAEVVDLLARAGADLNAKAIAFDWKGIKHGGVQSQLPAGGLTPLLQAARQNSVEAGQVLLKAGADANLKDPQGISPLRVAISNGHLDLAKIMLEAGADPNEGGLVEAVKFRTTTMMRAANNRENTTTALELINLLFAKGAKADSLAAVGLPKKDAFEAGSPAGVSPSETALYLAAGAQDIELMKLMIAKGADVNHETDKGWTPLMVSVGRTNKRPAMNGETLIALKPAAKRIEAATLLLDHGAKINGGDKTGVTTLHAMAGQGEDAVVEFLVAKGAKLDLKDTSNRTALDVARAVPIIPPEGAFVSTDPRDAPPVRPSTIALLGKLMAANNIKEVPYTLPPKAGDAKTPAKVAGNTGTAPRKPVTAVIGN
jgi:ankyrin repeat protein